MLIFEVSNKQIEIMETLDQISNNGNQFTYNGHPANFKGCAVDQHPTSKSQHKWRIYDCRTREIRVTEWTSAGNLSTFGYINGECVMILSYGLNIKENF